MKLRLLMFADCNRTCAGCCNKDFDLRALPVCDTFKDYECIILTGGEPMLKPQLIKETVEKIRQETNAPIYVYTAWSKDPIMLLWLLNFVDGITLTLHTRKDIEPFLWLNSILTAQFVKGKSLRLNVFSGIDLKDADLSKWVVKKDIKWIKNCPLPKDEVFMRL